MILSLLILIITITSIGIIKKHQSTSNHYQNQIATAFAEAPIFKPVLITERDLEHLPEPVKKYLHYVGVVGTEKVHHFSVHIDGDFKMAQDKEWAPVLVDQMSFVNKPIRLFLMELKTMGMKIVGLHHYDGTNASMVIKLLDLFTVVDASGPEGNLGETVTVFNDMCVLAPSTLIDPRIEWKEIDDLTVEATFTNRHLSINAILYFNESGQLVNYISNDRYYLNKDKSYDLIPWSTPVGNYREVNGLNIATYGEAIWLKEEAPFTYARFNIRDVIINP